MKILQLDHNHSLIKEQLEQKGIIVDEDFTSSYSEVLKKIDKYQGIIIRSRIPIDKKLMTHAKQLKFIARVGAGLENIDTIEAEKLGIKVLNSPEGNKDAVAEHVLAVLLMLMNRLNICTQEVKNGIWKREENRGEELLGKTIGIIGYGNTGKATAKRLSGFGCNVVFHDILPNLEDEFATQLPLEEIYKITDIISLHIPLSAETFGFINSTFINKMKKPFYLVNTARGQNIVTKDIVKAIKSGKILGAALDVLEYEKPSFENIETQNPDLQFLLDSEKVIITPHIAGWTHQSKIKLAQVIVDKITKTFLD